MRLHRLGLLQLALWLAAGVAAALWRPLLSAWALHGAAVGLLLALDALRLRRLPAPAARREVAGSLPLGVWSTVRLILDHPGPSRLRLEVFDHPPVRAEVEGLPTDADLPPRSRYELSYRLRPGRRGEAVFGRVDVLLRSPWGMWQRRLRIGEEQRVRVLPNFRPVAAYALLGVENRLGSMGIRLQRRRGEGQDFQELRDWREGDSLRQIDWKATARRGSLVSREYQDERDQQVILLLDCGRRMRSSDGRLTHFDHALNAVLLLTYAAVRQGDAVGLATFSGEHRWMAPTKGNAALSAMMGTVYDLESSLEPPDYLAAARRLAALQRRRALVVLVSNLRDEDASELLPAVRMLGMRHLVLLASLREKVLDQSLSRPPEELEEALLSASVHRYLAARKRTQESLRAQGVLTVDALPDGLAVAAVNRYLEIKRGGLL